MSDKKNLGLNKEIQKVVDEATSSDCNSSSK